MTGIMVHSRSIDNHVFVHLGFRFNRLVSDQVDIAAAEHIEHGNRQKQRDEEDGDEKDAEIKFTVINQVHKKESDQHSLNGSDQNRHDSVPAAEMYE